ncbi:MAG: transposase, partial [candidate division WOR-3 bacterium]
KMLILEYLYNLSDVAVSQAVNCNILFKWFCGLDIDELAQDDTTLVKFRRRFGEDGFKAVFTDFIEQVKRLGYGKGKLRILDATCVVSFSRGLNVVNLLKDGIKRVLRRVKEKALPLSEKVKANALKLIKVKRWVKLLELKKGVKQLMRELNGEVDKRSEKILDLMKQVIDNGKTIGRLVDFDAAWGYKSKSLPIFGYKVHLVYDESRFITNLKVLSGDKNKGSRLNEMIEKEPKGQIKGVCGDALYDTKFNRDYLAVNGIEAYIPARRGSSEIDTFILEGGRVRYISGKVSIGKINQERGELHYFSAKDYGGCGHYGGCISAGEIRKRVYISESKRLRDVEYKKGIGIRRVIERVIRWLKRWLGL